MKAKNVAINNQLYVSSMQIRAEPVNFMHFLLQTSAMYGDGKFPEIFTGENFPETIPTMFTHRLLLAYFLL
jgi:hypothetical protein